MNSSQKKYTVAILGAGRIAAGFDTPQSPLVLSHAHAFYSHASFSLLGFVDPDTSRLEVAERWGVPHYPTVAKLCAQHVPDVFVIASPDHTHASLLLEVLEYKPRLVICEKPLVTTHDELEKVVQGVAAHATPVVVNYSRRYDAAMVSLKELIQNAALGKVVHAVGMYSGDLVHNGSHMIDLMRFLLGDVRTTTPLSFERCAEATVVETNKDNYSLFELDLLMEKGRVRISDNGHTVSMQGTQESSIYSGYTVLGAPQDAHTKLTEALPALVDACAQMLNTDNFEAAGFLDAVKTQQALFELERIYGSK